MTLLTPIWMGTTPQIWFDNFEKRSFLENINSFLCMANVICTSEINVTTYTVFLYISAEILKYGTCTVSAAKNQFIRKKLKFAAH